MNKIAVMQPYFYPYLGYFALIKHTDRFIFFDTPQYIRRGWINRNRILHPKDGTIYINVPINKAPVNTPINEIYIKNSEFWQERIYGQLSYYRKAPNYSIVIGIIKEIFNYKYELLSELNIAIIKQVCQYLDIKCQFDTLSEMNLSIPKVNEPDDWALNITKALGMNIYVNPPGGISIYSREKYNRENIDLRFLSLNLKPYKQNREIFTPGLSIIDAMMFLSKEEIYNLLDDVIYF